MKNKKKGFTLVELVIVIAVIAILAGVLIGTFATVIENANKSKAMQETKNAFTEYLTEIDYTTESNKALISYVIKNGKYYFAVKKGQFITTVYSTAEQAILATEEAVNENELYEDAPDAIATDAYYFVKDTVSGYYKVVKVEHN